ncbi:hypothetical protein [Novosphingobium cyanobacteriorum]|uniref:Uncharacterized protein n=1 Tax=Novosphingobium cyanobacteriorum TaxID=3024215 RepID=A0ABT6CFE6_9SPHN|nr:hypothetical protein [Novosphingobium cyanobacteriorum]MDF8332647.1 hypothetical protein [Novosphingobium cyanobacteriorum]
MKTDTLTRYAGLLTLPVAVAAVVATAEAPRNLRPAARPDHRIAPQALNHAHADAPLDWLWSEIDPFADEDVGDAAALEARHAAEDNRDLA